MTATVVEVSRMTQEHGTRTDDAQPLAPPVLVPLETDPRVTKREFISRVAQRSGKPIRVVNQVYEALIAELFDAAGRDETVVLTGFGRFYRQAHKGHKVRFGRSRVDDYSVLKFSAARGLNRQLGQDCTEEELRSIS